MRISIVLLALWCLFTSPVQAADITQARFSLPTDSYDHCVLGDCTEYKAVEAILEDGYMLSFRLTDDSVFEDVTPRLVPMGLNGKKAILTIRSYPETGAALVLLEVRGGKLKITAESAPIGTAHRWQNPIGAADFDRDGKIEIASVHTPHLHGVLTLYERRGKKLVIDKQAQAFSNHQPGSAQLDMHEIMNWDLDNMPDIILPDITRTTLKVVSFKSGEAEIIAEKKFKALITGPITADSSGLDVVLSDGNTEHWSRK
ncbi:hypothetical protein [Terasakiella pusilla]|uniref:hypothetical protein n=1 Tax=Terasakiella pusilla TaxID=64973 RepID=UPI003AA8CE07